MNVHIMYFTYIYIEYLSTREYELKEEKKLFTSCLMLYPYKRRICMKYKYLLIQFNAYLLRKPFTFTVNVLRREITR